MDTFDRGPDSAFRADEMVPANDEVVELSLLLPSWQIAALEMVAHDQGLTTGQMVRQVLRQFFAQLPVLAARPDAFSRCAGL